MDARKAAMNEGWYEILPNYWVHDDPLAILMWEKPLYWNGSAKDLCLGQGIKFDD